jgi:hypothetical protein
VATRQTAGPTLQVDAGIALVSVIPDAGLRRASLPLGLFFSADRSTATEIGRVLKEDSP